MRVRGGCLCQSVAFEVDLPLVKFIKCYCSRCRGATGSAFAANAYVLPTAFRWTSGAENVAWQLCKVRGDAPGLTAGEEMRRRFAVPAGPPNRLGERHGRP
jgi:Glutathione-dependent formaldehyde-activating enzyme